MRRFTQRRVRRFLGDIQLEASARHSRHSILVSALESDQYLGLLRLDNAGRTLCKVNHTFYTVSLLVLTINCTAGTLEMILGQCQ